MVRLMKQHLAKFGRQDGVEYNKIIHFFGTSVVKWVNLFSKTIKSCFATLMSTQLGPILIDYN